MLRSNRALVAALVLVLGCAASEKPSARNFPEPAPEPGAAESQTPVVTVVPAPEAEPESAEPAGGALLPALEGASDWAVFHGNPARSGSSPARALKAPKLAWKARVGIQGWLNSPLVVGGTVLVPSSGKTHNAADAEDGLYAFDLATGKQLWFAGLGGDANGAAADKTRAYVSSDDGQLYAIALRDGSVLWKQPGTGKMYSHPLLVGQLVIAGDSAGFVRAFDIETGKPRWAVQLSGAIRGGASADARHVYVVSQAGELAAIDFAGRVIYRKTVVRPAWEGQKDVAIEAYSPPIVSGKELVLPFARDTTYTGKPALLAVRASDGVGSWRARGADDWANVRSTPALVGDLLIYAEAYSGDVAAVSASTGRVVYRRSIGACYFPQWSSPVAAGETVYVMRFDAVLHALRATDGKLLWRFYLGDSTRAGPQVPPELEPAQGCEWDVPTGNAAYSPLAVAENGTLLAGTHEGYIYALGH